MLGVVKGWGHRYLSDPQAILFLVLLCGGLLLVMVMGQILAPVIASIIIAYLLQWFVNILTRCKVSRLTAVLVVYSAFLGLFLGAIFILWPIIWQQFLRLFEEFPSMITKAQQFLYLMPEKFPQYLTKETVDGWVAGFLVQLKQTAKILFTVSLTSLPNVIALIIYLVLGPLMVFFFLKDNKAIARWCINFLPNDRRFLTKLWQEMHQQIGNYILGKGAEVIIVGFSTYLIFYLFNMHYAVLLAVLVGLSVLIPYIGVVVVTIPVVLVAFFQWGLGSHFAYLVTAYSALQALDGALLVPLLFSEAVNLHPLAIIIAVLVFGGWWGFWGVFFAIPLATLVKAVIETWPRTV